MTSVTYATGYPHPFVVGKVRRARWAVTITLRWPFCSEVIELETSNLLTPGELLPVAHGAVRESFGDLGEPSYFKIQARSI